MRRICSLPYLLLVTIGLTACSNWKMVWHDEFSGPAGELPDSSKWEFDIGGHGWGNQELEYYTSQPENVSLDGNGLLVISELAAQASTTGGLDCWYGPCQYTSARILTGDQFSFTYGRVDARIKIPAGQGIWPAFWLLGSNCSEAGWPECGEIDIMEIKGNSPSVVHASVHGPGKSGAYVIGKTYTLPHNLSFSDDFHLFSLEWGPDEIRWSVDGHQYAAQNRAQFPTDYRWVFDHPFILILNVAVGGNWTGNPDATTNFPQQMVVDYVRVYQQP